MISFKLGSLALTLTLPGLAVCLACRSGPDPGAPNPARLDESNGAAIVGEWAIESVAGANFFEPAKPYLAFEPDGSVHGDASVNRISGTWSWAEDLLELSPLATTLMAGPPTLMSQERSLLSALERVNAARIGGDGRLELFELGGDTLIRARRVASERYGAGHFVGTNRQYGTGHFAATHARRSVRHRIGC